MRVLHVTSELDGGGIERLLFDYCTRLSKTIEFDFAINSESEGILEKPLKEAGCNIYRIPKLHEGLINYYKQLSDILRKGKYDIIHVHSAYKAFMPLLVAKKNGVKVRIAHSHICNAPESVKQKMIRKFSTLITKYYATDLFACGSDAGKWVWGNNADFYVMTNAINVDKFKFDDNKRKQIRKELKIEDKFVIGNVARFSFQKNHEFLINVFSSVVKVCPNAVLLLVGQGELMDDVKRQIKTLDLDKSVIMLGVRDDVPDLLNAMDLFVLPSRFEGLPVTLVEVQANGLPAIASDTITKEMSSGNTIEFLKLKQDVWIEKIKYYINLIKKPNNRSCGVERTYIIDNAIVDLQRYYISVAERN